MLYVVKERTIHRRLGVIQKIRGQDEVGRWSKNMSILVHVLGKNVHVEVGRKVVKKGQNFVYVGIE